MAPYLFSACLEAVVNVNSFSSSGPASMTRTQPSASPTTSRAWRAIAALMFSLVLAPVAMADEPVAPAASTPAAAAAPADASAAAQAPADGAATQASVADGQAAAGENVEALVEDTSLGMAHDLSPWGMYKNADIVVKIVMIGLAIASIITWTIWIAKGFELMGAKRRLRGEVEVLKKVASSRKPAKPPTRKAPWPIPWFTMRWKKCACRPTPARKKASRSASASVWSAWLPPAAVT